jgi:hypothetical protein
MTDRPSAISPRFFHEYRDVEDYVNEYGFAQWKFNADIPDGINKKWFEAFLEWVKELSPIEQARVKELIKDKAIQQTLTPQFQSEKGIGKNWREVMKALNLRQFDVIAGDFLDPSPFASWQAILSEIRKEKRDTFTYQATIYVEDPYFMPCANEETDLLKELLAGMRGAKCYALHFITRDIYRARRRDYKEILEKDSTYPKNYEELDRELKKRFLSLLDNDRKLFIHLVDDSERKSGNYLVLHKRRVVGNLGTLRFEKGLKTTRQMEEAGTVSLKGHKEGKQFIETQIIKFAERLPTKANEKRPKQVTTFVVANTMH